MLELVQRTGGMFIPPHDHVTNTYTGSQLIRVDYRRGGATGQIVATQTLTYDAGGNLETVTLT